MEKIMKIINQNFLKYLIIILIFIIFSPYTNALSVWEKPIQPPCETEDQTAWDGPFEKRFCAGDEGFTFPDPPCDGNCCFIVIYYERWAGQNHNAYEIYISGVFRSGSLDCDDCPIFNAYAEFIHRFLREKQTSMGAEFYNKISNSGRVSTREGFDYYILNYSVGKCYNSGNECDQVFRCCSHIVDLEFGGYGHPDWFLQSTYCCNNPGYILTACPPSCTPSCYESATGMEFCDMPCNIGAWQSEQFFIKNLYMCNGVQCKLKITYKKRLTMCNGVTYYDYQLISTEPIDCENCNYIAAEYHSFAIDYLLKDGGLPLPDLNKCDTNYRMVEAKCWKYDNGKIIYCNTDNCCRSTWKVCNENYVYTTTRLSGSEFSEECEDPNCFSFCTVYPVKIPTSVYNNSINSDELAKHSFMTYSTPNPTTGKSDIYITSDFIGMVKLKVYDINGNFVLEFDKDKKSYEVILPIDISKMSNGVYYYRIFVNDKVVNQNSLIVNH